MQHTSLLHVCITSKSLSVTYRLPSYHCYLAAGELGPLFLLSLASNNRFWCQIWVCHSRVPKHSGLLGHDTVSLGDQSLTFQRNTTFKTSGTTHPMTQRHMLEDLNPKILVSWDVPPCSLVQSHVTLAAARYQTTWCYTPEYSTNPQFYTEWGEIKFLWRKQGKLWCMNRK
jgi:hypothetical protein